MVFTQKKTEANYLKLLDYINDAFLAKLYGYSRSKVKGATYKLQGKTFEDFTNEALTLVMEGKRKTPEWVVDSDTALNFMTSVVCSLVSNGFSSKEAGLPAISIENISELSIATSSEEDIIASQEAEATDKLMVQLREKLRGKENALKCLEAYLEIDVGEAGGQINKLLVEKTKLSMADVLAAKKQMYRMMKSIKDGNK